MGCMCIYDVWEEHSRVDKGPNAEASLLATHVVTLLLRKEPDLLSHSPSLPILCSFLLDTALLISSSQPPTGVS